MIDHYLIINYFHIQIIFVALLFMHRMPRREHFWLRLTLCGIPYLLLPFLIPGVLVMASAGVNNVIITVFLANTVDYGDLKNNRRDESVIFSMQTFVVKLASGIAAFVASIALSVLNLKQVTEGAASEANIDFAEGVSAASKMGLRMVMTIIPIFVLILGVLIFKRKFILNDEKVEEITKELKNRNEK